jgi:hypothetical protein
MIKRSAVCRTGERDIYVKAKAEQILGFFGSIRTAAGSGGVRKGSEAIVESRPGMIGHIILDTKQTGRRSAGNPHATSDVAGAGNGFTVQILRHSQRKRGAMARLNLRNTAPALDPT